ncbi:unnamed protein product [Clonostachys rosea]|uniref:Ubiquitin-like domain-containing protein n=1 Tax=Bionectria ochroleuca TaxID=29856 RepID=A0ABY6TPV3_BIOOC|nr:unnamed protein product [Clonostachys rosea]
MSFGYSVSDFITGANITYRLIRVLADSSGASEEYQDAMLELSAMQQAFLQVSQMTQNPVIPQATINSASHIVMSAMDIISHFLDRSRIYQKKLGGGTKSNENESLASRTEDSWTKVGWSLFKREELKDLRDRLQSKLSSIQLLLSASAYCYLPSRGVSIYQVPPSKEETDLANSLKNTATIARSQSIEGQPSINHSQKLHDLSSNTTRSLPASPNFEKLVVHTNEPPRSSCGTTSTDTMPPANESTGTSMSSTTLIEEDRPRSAESGAGSLPQLHRQDTVPLGVVKDMNQLAMRWVADLTIQQVNPDTVEKLRKILADGIQAMKSELDGPILFTDAVGRKFSFPFRLVMVWAGMQELIQQAFLQVETLEAHVHEGHYDLIGPDGEILLPSVWAKLITPGMHIRMTMWPIEKPARQPPATQPPARQPPPSIPPFDLEEGHIVPPLNIRGRSKQKKISRGEVVRKSQSSWTTESSDDDSNYFGSARSNSSDEN